MSYLKRAWLYVTRKKVKSLIMFMILTLMTFSTISGIALKNSVHHFVENVEKTAFSGVSLQTTLRASFSSSRGFGSLTNSEINSLATLENVKSYVKRMVAMTDIVDGKFLDVPGNDAIKKLESYATFSDMFGVNDSKLENKFVSGTIKLTKGRHIKEDDVNTVLIHEELATLNNYKIGDKITFKTNTTDPDNVGKKVVNQTVTIVGLFSGKNSRRAVTRFDLYQNIIISDLTTTRNLNSYTEKTEIYHDATFFTTNSKEVDAFIKEARKKEIDWQRYKLTKTSSNYVVLNNSINAMSDIVNKLLLGSIIITIVVLSSILFMWIKERRKEMAILLSIGTSKLQLVLQYISELVMIFVIALSCGVILGNTTKNMIGNSILGTVQKSMTKDLLRQINLGADAESSVLNKTIDKLSVTVTTMDIMYVALIGLAIIVVCVVLVSIPMLATKPKALLEELE